MDSKRVLDIFKTITCIPRESGHEEKISAWILGRAAELGLSATTDSAGNVLITREAAPGKENVPAIVLQAHMDMVCEKTPESSQDFEKDPIPYVIENGWMISKETTLGADDGIGIAACMALLEDSCPTGKIECLFTVSEETGMDGAFAVREDFFEGRTLLNLDSEDEGQLFIGCAGGMTTNVRFNMKKAEAKKGYVPVKIEISGGRGGHSGDDINKGRANVVQLMSGFLHEELEHGLQLYSVEGGGKHNAIARDCHANIAVPDAGATYSRLLEYVVKLRNEFHNTDPNLSCMMSEDFIPETDPFSRIDTEKLIASLFSCPHGMYAMSQDIPDLVQTSTNLASIKTNPDGRISIVTSQRSSSADELHSMAAKVRCVFTLAGAEVEHTDAYPGWAPDINSPILKICIESYRRLFSVEPEVKAIHAGVECGLFLEKIPGLDMISFGPTLRDVHAPGEKLDLSSLDRFVSHLYDVVTNFS